MKSRIEGFVFRMMQVSAEDRLIIDTCLRTRGKLDSDGRMEYKPPEITGVLRNALAWGALVTLQDNPHLFVFGTLGFVGTPVILLLCLIMGRWNGG